MHKGAQLTGCYRYTAVLLFARSIPLRKLEHRWHRYWPYLTYRQLNLIPESRTLLQSSSCVRSPYPSVMTAARPIHASTTFYSFNSDVPASGEGPRPPIPDGTSPLLKHKHAHAHQPTMSGPRPSALPSFLDVNAGLLLVAASQLFLSAMNLSVKFLSNLDEPVSPLEV